MPAANHHIFVDQGSTFKLFFEYQTQGSTAIDLSSYSANMQKMGIALGRLAQEDPSFRVKTDEETNQTIISRQVFNI